MLLSLVLLACSPAPVAEPVAAPVTEPAPVAEAAKPEWYVSLGEPFTATEAEAYAAIYALAAGELSESALAEWFEQHSKARRAR